jgi:putative transposase
LLEALRRFFPEAVHQRCQVHYLRNALDRVASKSAFDQVKQELADVWSAPTKAMAELRAAPWITQLRSTLPAVADWVESSIGDTLAVYARRQGGAARLRTTNGIEHDHMAVRRRTAVIRVFPNGASLLWLVSALAMERNEKWLARRYVVALEQVLTPEALMPAA